MKRCGKMMFVGLVALLLLSALMLPAFAETETADGGDLLRAADELKVTDSVGGDLLALAMNLTVQGEVKGSIRACATEMLLNGAVGRNVTVAGMTVKCDEQFDAKDVKIAGNQVVFLGTCDTLSVYGETVYIGGTVREKVVCEAGQVIFLEDAKFASAEVTSSSDPLVVSGLKDNSYKSLDSLALREAVTFKKTRSAFVSDLISLPFTMLAAVAVALLVTLVLRRMPDRASRQFKAHPISFCLRGFAAMLLIPLAAILFLLPAITWPISVAILLLYLVVFLLANAIAAVVLSRVWLAKWNPFLSAALVAAVIAILSILPYVGLLVDLIVMTVGFGAVASLIRKRREPMVSAGPEMDFRV
ncbi:MAG: hypothetical protein J1E00_02645 [Oscillospiraceae bacterium]|nr:hypothetical protein [Oscillospiraceae bacterium]